MQRWIFRATCLAIALNLILVCWACPCEIRLKSEIISPLGLVRLRDIATISGVEPDVRTAMEQLIVAPAPAPSRSRLVTASNLRHILEQHGVEMSKCRLTGSTGVRIRGSAIPRSTSAGTSAAGVTQVAFEDSVARRHDLEYVKQQVVQAVMKQLDRDDQPEDTWQVEVEFARRALWNLPAQWREIRVEGLKPPWEGNHAVTARFASAREVARLPVEVRIRRPRRVVVTLRPLDRGDIIGPRDVRLSRVERTGTLSTAARTLEEVVGYQVKQSVAAGKILGTTAVTPPLLVHRREIINVVARTGSIQVKRKAESLGDGAKGDIIMVKILEGGRERFSAHVVGYKRAEVFVGPATVAGN